MDNIVQIAIYLIKTLCIDHNADTATITKDMTFDGKYIGTYEIKIKKLKKRLTKQN